MSSEHALPELIGTGEGEFPPRRLTVVTARAIGTGLTLAEGLPVGDGGDDARLGLAEQRGGRVQAVVEVDVGADASGVTIAWQWAAMARRERSALSGTLQEKIAGLHPVIGRCVNDFVKTVGNLRRETDRAVAGQCPRRRGPDRDGCVADKFEGHRDIAFVVALQ